MLQHTYQRTECNTAHWWLLLFKTDFTAISFLIHFQTVNILNISSMKLTKHPILTVKICNISTL